MDSVLNNETNKTKLKLKSAKLFVVDDCFFTFAAGRVSLTLVSVCKCVHVSVCQGVLGKVRSISDRV